MSSIKIAGIGGVGMLAMVGVLVYARPEFRLFVLLSYGAGILGAFSFITYRRWVKPESPHAPTLMTAHTTEPISKSEDDDPIDRETPSELSVVH